MSIYNDHECSFPEERGPNGPTVLYPCLECGISAADAMKHLKSRLDSPSHLSLTCIEDLWEEIKARCEKALLVTVRSEDAGAPVVEVSFHGGVVAGVGLARVGHEFLMRKVFEETEK